jgi:sulfate transport system permease protein
MANLNRRILPGFGLSLSTTVLYLTVLVLVPLGACCLKASSLTAGQFWDAVWNERAQAAYALTFGASLAAAALNVVLGLVLAWVLVRYDFPLKRVFDSLIDLPFALPTAVAGLVYAKLYMPDGWVGQFLAPLGVDLSRSRAAIVLVLTFVGLPFVVRAIQPVLEGIEAEVEEAAAALGASRWQTFRRVLFPTLLPALLTGFALALARAIGEYGSVVFVASNKQYGGEIAPILIVSRLEEGSYGAAAAIAVVLLAASFVLLLVINLLERWSKKFGA